MTGSVIQVSISRGGIPKRAVPAGELTAAGIAGDAWRYPFHGGPRQAVLIVTSEGIDELIAQGFPLFPGALGENITTRGIDRRGFRIGQHWRIGDAEIALTRIRVPCATLNVYGPGVQAAMYDARVKAGDPQSERWGLSGFYAAVVQPATIHAGDPIVCG